MRGYVDFFFQLNLVPPYLLRSQEDNLINFWFLIFLIQIITWVMEKPISSLQIDEIVFPNYCEFGKHHLVNFLKISQILRNKTNLNLNMLMTGLTHGTEPA